MNSIELVDSFLEFKDLKNIDKQTMQHVLEDVFRAMFKKKFSIDSSGSGFSPNAKPLANAINKF